ncbi:MAG: hypothetical protein H7Y03_06655, partial [Chitinophagaceae bacterium]|nr:hypothetical protein [Chitinophagaceae bacterium]
GASAVVSGTGVDSSDAVVGARVLIWGYVMGVGYPPLTLRHEYNEISAINTGTDTITLKFPLKYSYLSTWFDQEGESIGGAPDEGVGKPRITFLDRAAGKYPRYAEFRDLTFGSNTGAGSLHAAIYPAQILKISNCKVEGFFWPSECETITIEDSEVVGLSEFDRLVSNLYCKKVKFNNEISGAAGINNVIMDECQVAESLQIAPRKFSIKNSDLRGSSLPSVFSGAMENHAGKFPMTNITIEGLRISSGPTNTSGAMLAVAPYSTFVLAVVSGNNILIPNTGLDAMFDLPRSIEGGSTKLFKNDGTKGGVVTSITFDATYNAGQGAFVIAGNWATPVVAETWVWCSVKSVIDNGGHQNFSSFRLWHENSMRWMGNKSDGRIKEMRFTEKDLLWSGSRTLTVPWYAHIINIEIYVGKIATVGNKLSILNGAFAEIITINMQELGWRKLTHEEAMSAKSGDVLSTTEIVPWQQSILLLTHNGSFAALSDITAPALPEFEMIIRWSEF